MEQQRVIIVDYNHLVYKYLMGGADRLSHTVMMNGVPTTIDTTIPAYTMKTLVRWSNKGKNVLAVCFDSPCPRRKQYFSQRGTEKNAGYKDGRKPLSGVAYDGMNITLNILNAGGVSVYKKDGYEADDLVYSAVLAAKEAYPGVPIDVVCNDADLLPLVDKQVSVFFRSVKLTWAEDKSLEKKGYIQVTPDNYQEVVEGLSAYKKMCVPYNTILLHKLLRGDASDKIAGHPDYKPRMYNYLVSLLMDEGIDISSVFRYGDESQLDYICQTLYQFVDEPDLEHIRFVYNGINLQRLRLKTPAHYDPLRLQKEASVLAINLGVGV